MTQSKKDFFEGCPVELLGRWSYNVYGGSHRYEYYISPDGRKFKFEIGGYTRENILKLFAGDDTWLQEKFPEVTEEDGEVRKDHSSFNVTLALFWLTDASSEAGLCYEHDDPSFILKSE